MNDYQLQYQQKLVSAEQAAQVVQNGDWVDYGWATGFPVAVDQALAERLPKLQNIKFRSGLSCHVPAVFQIEQPQEHMCWNSWHMSGIDRKANDEGFGFYLPLRYSELPRYYRESQTPLNVVAIQVAPMDEQGWFNFGPNASHLAALCEKAQCLIVEVNKKMPLCLGTKENAVHIAAVDLIVEGTNPALDILGGGEATEVDIAVARQIVEKIPNGACLQLGIGGMPNTVGKLLAASDLQDLGVHTEMYVDAFVDLSLAGKITGKHKALDPGKQAYAFGVGTKKLYDFLNNNPACLSCSVDYTNDVRNIAALDNFVSINNAIDIDLYCQVNAESVGARNISGAGGQLDFVLGAYLSKGGQSFICMSSAYRDKKTGRLISRIRPTLGQGSIVTDTRTNVMYVVTEYGCVNLKGLSTWERAEALISIAHPAFRENLIKAAAKQHIWCQTNKLN